MSSHYESENARLAAYEHWAESTRLHGVRSVTAIEAFRAGWEARKAAQLARVFGFARGPDWTVAQFLERKELQRDTPWPPSQECLPGEAGE